MSLELLEFPLLEPQPPDSSNGNTNNSSSGSGSGSGSGSSGNSNGSNSRGGNSSGNSGSPHRTTYLPAPIITSSFASTAHVPAATTTTTTTMMMTAEFGGLRDEPGTDLFLYAPDYLDDSTSGPSSSTGLASPLSSPLPALSTLSVLDSDSHSLSHSYALSQSLSHSHPHSPSPLAHRALLDGSIDPYEQHRADTASPTTSGGESEQSPPDSHSQSLLMKESRSDPVLHKLANRLSAPSPIMPSYWPSSSPLSPHGAGGLSSSSLSLSPPSASLSPSLIGGGASQRRASGSMHRGTKQEKAMRRAASTPTLLRPDGGRYDPNVEGFVYRRRNRTTPEQLITLEDAYQRSATLGPAERDSLAERLNMQPQSIRIWFQNRRAKEKREKSLKSVDGTTVTVSSIGVSSGNGSGSSSLPISPQPRKSSSSPSPLKYPKPRPRPRRGSLPAPVSGAAVSAAGKSTEAASAASGSARRHHHQAQKQQQSPPQQQQQQQQQQQLLLQQSAATPMQGVSPMEAQESCVMFAIGRLKIGHWTRYNLSPNHQDLTCVFDMRQRVVSYVIVDGANSWKIQFQFDSIFSLEFYVGRATEPSITMQLRRPPFFFVKLKYDQNQETWQHCNDITEDQQATSSPEHQLRIFEAQKITDLMLLLRPDFHLGHLFRLRDSSDLLRPDGRSVRLIEKTLVKSQSAPMLPDQLANHLFHIPTTASTGDMPSYTNANQVYSISQPHLSPSAAVAAAAAATSLVPPPSSLQHLDIPIHYPSSGEFDFDDDDQSLPLPHRSRHMSLPAIYPVYSELGAAMVDDTPMMIAATTTATTASTTSTNSVAATTTIATTATSADESMSVASASYGRYPSNDDDDINIESFDPSLHVHDFFRDHDHDHGLM